MEATSTDLIKLLEFQRDLVDQVITYNLGYLGIAVGIIVALGGAFYLFNFRPLKDALSKQESELGEQAQLLKDTEENLRKETLSRLDDATDKVASLQETNKQEILSLVEEKLIESEALVSREIEASMRRETKSIKEQLLIEMKNLLLTSESELKEQINTLDKQLVQEAGSLDIKISSLKNKMDDVNRRIRELEVYKYSKEGQMGAIYGLVDLLNEAITNKEGWRINRYLDLLRKEIDGCYIDADIVSNIEEQLERLKEKKFDQIKKLIRDAYLLKAKEELAG